MAVFVSYSSQDRTSLDALTTALRRAQQQVWFDQELGGGDAWWHKILEQIRSCEVFIVALSNNWLQSKPSQAELRYAQALQRPILPVRVGPVDSVRVNPVATLQIVDYQNPTVDSAIQLVNAIHRLCAKEHPLPAVLPEEPPVPYAYLMRLGNTLSEKELTPQQQLQLLVELKSGLDEDGDDPCAQSDIAQLLRMLRMRHDVTYRTRSEIDAMLASIDARPSNAGPPTAVAAPGIHPDQPAIAQTAPTASSPPAPPGSPSPAQASRGRLLIAGGAGAAVVVAIVLVIFFVTQGSGQTPSATPRTPAQTGAAGASAAGPAPAQSGPLKPIMLGAAEVSTIMGVPNMELANQTQEMAPELQLSDAQCLGAFHPTQSVAYADSGFTGVHGQLLHSGNEYRVYEAAVSFPTAEKAQAFVAASADNWKACAGKAVTLTSGNKTSHWTFGELTGASPKITLPRTRGDGNQCQRVLSAASDVVLDVMACGVTIADQGSQIADQMASRVKQ